MEEQTKPKLLTKLYRGTMKLLRDTWIELAVPIVAGLVIGPIQGHISETLRSNKTEYRFSEITQMKEDAAIRGVDLHPLNEYLPSNYDYCNKYFESWSLASDSASSQKELVKLFAIHMHKRDTDKLHTHSPRILANRIDELSDLVLEQLSFYTEPMRELRPLIELYDSVWKEEHDDQYEDVWVTTTSTDADGNVTVSGYWDSQYDYTKHWYWVSKILGERALSDHQRLIRNHSDLTFPYLMQKPSKMNKEGMRVIEHAGKEEMTYEEMYERMLIWLSGSKFMLNQENIVNNYKRLVKTAEKWKDILPNVKPLRPTRHKNADYYHENTNSEESGGKCFRDRKRPRGCKTVDDIIEHGSKVYNSVTDIMNDINYVNRTVPDIMARTDSLVAKIVLNPKPDKQTIKWAEKEAKSIMNDTKTVYERMWPGGVNVKRYRLGMVFLYTLMWVGGLGGLGALANRFGPWNKWEDPNTPVRPLWQRRRNNYYS